MSCSGKDRCDTLAAFLEAGEIPGEFDPGTYADKWADGRPVDGTAADCLGWSTIIPAFRTAGLRLTDEGELAWGDLRCLEAAAAFLEITLEQAEATFDSLDVPSGTCGRQIVARRIRELVKEIE